MKIFAIAAIVIVAAQVDAQILRSRRSPPTNCRNGVCGVPLAELPSATPANDDGVRPNPSPADRRDDSTDLSPSGNGPEIVHQEKGEDETAVKNFGVDWNKIEPHKISLNGRNITCEHAIERIQSQVPNDSGKLRLVVIGSKDEREPVRRAWDDAPQELRDRVSPWFVSGDHWSLRDTITGELRFVIDGNPTIHLLGPDGESVGRMNRFTSTDDVEAIRRAVKKYDAAKDADLRLPDPHKKEDKATPATGGDNRFGLYLILALGIVIVWSIAARKGSST